MKPLSPIRLRDDPAAPQMPRADLTRAASTPAVVYDGARGLAALEAAIQSGAAPAAPLRLVGSDGRGGRSKSLAAAVAKGVLRGARDGGCRRHDGGAEPPNAPPGSFRRRTPLELL